MKTRLSYTRLKEKELAETTLGTGTRGNNNKLRRLDPKSKTNQGKKSKVSTKRKNKVFPDLLPDQQTEKEIFYDFRPFCVKVQRLKQKKVMKCGETESMPGFTTQKQQDLCSDTSNFNRKNRVYCERQKVITLDDDTEGDQNLNEDPNKNIRPCCVRIKRLAGTMSKEKNDLSKETKEGTIDHLGSEATTLQCHATPETFSFRNPKLALTRRKLNEMRLSKANGDIITGICPDINNPLNHRIEPIIRSANTDTVTVKNSEKDKKSISPRNLVNKPNIINELLLADNDIKEKSDSKITQDKSKQLLKTKENPLNKTKQVRKNLKRYRIKTKSLCRKPAENENDVYEFLSQSQNSDSDVEKRKDPAADIIINMIEQGKVLVTRNLKGKPVLVNRKRNKKPALKKNRILQENKKIIEKRKQFQPTHTIIPEAEEHTHFEENVEDASKNVGTSPLTQDNSKISNKVIPSNEATFSSLARSVLIQQTNHKNSGGQNLADKKRLLQITSREASTPIKRPRLSLLTEVVDLSHIPKSNDKAIILESAPVDAMDFELNASYDPSLIGIEVSNVPQINPILTPLNEREGLAQTHQISRQQSSLSSFSSNDSNAENMPPSPRKGGSEIRDENSSIFNNRQTPNPRRTLQNRSALQPINIIDVILLPPYREPVVLNKDISDPKKNEDKQPLFGFEEYLNEDKNELQETSNHNNSSSLSLTNLRSRLKKLKKWRPNVPRYNDAKSSTITKHIFDDKFTKEREHQDIRNMLCSTMVSSSSKNANNTSTNITIDSSDEDTDEDSTRISKNENAVDLFGDPETTFDVENLQRTYERPFKNKRKIQHQHHHQQNSKKIESEIESDNDELEKFVSEFNSIIKEAEEYELIVE